MASAKETHRFFPTLSGEDKETPPPEGQPKRGLLALKKKRHHRRKSNKKRPTGHLETDPRSPDEKPTTSEEGKVRSRRRRHPQGSGQKHGKAWSLAKRGIVLRPTKVPLLNAPRNSTQFIIDDHESTDQLLSDEVRGARRDRTRGIDARVEEGHGAEDAREAGGGPTPPTSSVRIDDEDTYWRYSENDFQLVYESTHQEVVASWTREELIDGICSLERRVKELVNRLSRFDSEIYLQHLEDQLQRVSEENRTLAQLAKTKGIDCSRIGQDGATEVDPDT